MMKRLLMMMALAGVALLAAGCFKAPVVPPFGYVMTLYSAPIDVEYGTEIGTKTGKSESTSILGLFSWGDASVNAAARNGQLSRVDYVGYDMLNVLGIYQGWTTVVYGE